MRNFSYSSSMKAMFAPNATDDMLFLTVAMGEGFSGQGALPPRSRGYYRKAARSLTPREGCGLVRLFELAQELTADVPESTVERLTPYTSFITATFPSFRTTGRDDLRRQALL